MKLTIPHTQERLLEAGAKLKEARLLLVQASELIYMIEGDLPELRGLIGTTLVDVRAAYQQLVHCDLGRVDVEIK